MAGLGILVLLTYKYRISLMHLSVQPHGLEVYEIIHSLTSASRGSYTIWLQVGRYPYVLDPATKVEFPLWVRGGYSGTDFIMAPVEL